MESSKNCPRDCHLDSTDSAAMYTVTDCLLNPLERGPKINLFVDPTDHENVFSKLALHQFYFVRNNLSWENSDAGVTSVLQKYCFEKLRFLTASATLKT